MVIDILIKNGWIIDGEDTPRFRGNIAIKGGKIVNIGAPEWEVEAKEIIDARGNIIAPGFIDTHVHSDLMLLWDRQHASGLCQGVTTEILGQDGLSYAPLSRKNLEMYTKYLSGLNGHPPGISKDWSSVYDYRMKLDGTVAINTAYQIPHGPLRLETVGMENVPLAGRDLERAKALLDQGLKEGAVAFSTGLSYFPCAYADTNELVELCKVAAENDSVYVTHIRTVFLHEHIDPVLETIEIAKRSGVKIHFSHFRTRVDDAGKVDEFLKEVDDAYQSGIDVTCELYPYPNGSGHAVIFLPPWTVEGGYEATLERLSDKRLRNAINEGIEQNEIPCAGYFTHLPKNKQYIGRNFTDVAKERGQSVADLICDLLVEENLQVGFQGLVPEPDEDVWETIQQDTLELMSRPYYMVGSDGIPLGEKPHPRAFGTFPRLLRFCREAGFRLEKMINRMTKIPADRFGLRDRGTLAVGKAADIVIFDANTVTDTATYENPRSAPKGIPYVLVNGCVAVRNEKVTGLFAGKALQRG